jgi:uncharacterized SAM-binding protein YcdF (DUF218 family)
MTHSHNPTPAEMLFRWLYVKDAPRRADLIIGFGHFDMEIPRQCGRLYEAGYASRILLTGGVGAGTADLGMPEGLAFRKLLRQEFPDIPDAHIVVESASTNTSENVTFSEKALRTADAGFCFGNGIKSVLAVASPYRQKRVVLTMKKLYPDIEVISTPPTSTFVAQRALFAMKQQELVPLLVGEVERLEKYAQLGWIAEEPLPPEIKAAYAALKNPAAE